MNGYWSVTLSHEDRWRWFVADTLEIACRRAMNERLPNRETWVVMTWVAKESHA